MNTCEYVFSTLGVQGRVFLISRSVGARPPGLRARAPLFQKQKHFLKTAPRPLKARLSGAGVGLGAGWAWGGWPLVLESVQLDLTLTPKVSAGLPPICPLFIPPRPLPWTPW